MCEFMSLSTSSTPSCLGIWYWYICDRSSWKSHPYILPSILSCFHVQNGWAMWTASSGDIWVTEPAGLAEGRFVSKLSLWPVFPASPIPSLGSRHHLWSPTAGLEVDVESNSLLGKIIVLALLFPGQIWHWMWGFVILKGPLRFGIWSGEWQVPQVWPP